MGKGQRKKREAQEAAQRILQRLCRPPKRPDEGTFDELNIKLRYLPPDLPEERKCRVRSGFLPSDDIPTGTFVYVLKRTFRFYSKIVEVVTGYDDNTSWLLLPCSRTEHGMGNHNTMIALREIRGEKYLERYLECDSCKRGERGFLDLLGCPECDGRKSFLRRQPNIVAMNMYFYQEDNDVILTLDHSLKELSDGNIRERIVEGALEWQDEENMFNHTRDLRGLLHSIEVVSSKGADNEDLIRAVADYNLAFYEWNMPFREKCSDVLSLLNRELEKKDIPIWNPDTHPLYYLCMRRWVVAFLSLKYRKEVKNVRRLPLELFCLVFSFAMTF